MTMSMLVDVNLDVSSRDQSKIYFYQKVDQFMVWMTVKCNRSSWESSSTSHRKILHGTSSGATRRMDRTASLNDIYTVDPTGL